MNDDELSQDGDTGEEALARRLEAYAAARLTPGSSASTRMRAQVMAAADRQAALVLHREPTPIHRGQRRRLVVALLAACLTLGLVVGSASASQAGGPLYPVRIWAETLTLPSSPSERATAEVRRLTARLAEASQASAAGDQAATDAALEAYGNIVDRATADAGTNLAAGAILESGVKHNVTVLTTLAGRVPEPARDAIQRAIERAIQRSDVAVDQIHASNGNPGRPTPASGPVATPNPDKTPAPDATPKPDRTPKPTATPTAGGPPGPGKTPGPSKTPGPGKTQPPGGQPSTKPGPPGSTPPSQSGG